MNRTKRTERWHPLRITDPVYGVDYLVMWNVKSTPDEEAAVLNYIQDEFAYIIKPSDRESFVIDTKNACTTTFARGNIVIQFGYDTHPGTSTLVHEAFHAMMAVFTWRGVHLSAQDDEHGAYYLGWLCSAIVEHGHKYKLWNGSEK